MEEQSEKSTIRHGIAPTAKARAVAVYMIAHNDKHIDELAALVEGMDKRAANLLLDAIGSYEVGNTQLRQLIEYLDQQ